MNPSKFCPFLYKKKIRKNLECPRISIPVLISNINNDFKIFFNKHLKLKNLKEKNDKIIIDLQNFIEEQNLIIEILKDKNPHG